MENLGYYNGKYGLIEEMQIPMLDRVCWFGDGIYDATYAHNHKIFDMDAHLNRFYNSAKLLDINMPKMNCLEVLQEIRKQKMNIKVLVLTIHNEVEYLLRAVDIGINGYILKDSESSVLKKAIFAVHNGETYIQPSLSPLLNSKMIDRDVDKEKIKSLTRRELDVLKLLAEGLFNKEIAFKLDISERTVKNHVSNIFKKIDVADRTQAAVFAIRNNLIGLF